MPTTHFAIGGALIVVAVGSFVFLDGSTAVFIGIASAIAGALFLVMGAQGPKQDPDVGLPSLDGTVVEPDLWAQFDREHGLGQDLPDFPDIDDEPRRNT
ncbi:hypothetical protein M3D57_05425 [Corynebacterium sanguinis]|uniref:Uncharacterized protein n=3 Tax=Corynebacterium TaxID=1716 RepID=A0A1G9PG71_9CORY|nr:MULTISPECIES: hypothetical protein [Corynebacterium]EEI18096.1 hypothetical protein HMPREF0298_0080 [Corynebacterium lipophiloflavum DSM 44291]MBA4504924.1 hypothetical protein [Corynebacterium sanguinis]MCT1412428.1 hypothetical protein [Corynebacterium sanguinis]MCT1414434.1 hypothetical protein [Corynebacterium sanguinis]MCT1425111.1 hypothetical protein [Corynebacterium sanguinis]